jgi:hypothetical protein
MSGISIEYRGHTIRWADNEDCWTCWDLGNKAKSSPKLSVIKAAIDKIYLAERKAASTQCWEINSHSGTREFANVIEYVGPKVERAWAGEITSETKHIVGVVAKREGSERNSRKDIETSRLAPVGEATDKAWAAYEVAMESRKLAQSRERDALAAVPRLSLDDINELVALASKGEDNA